MALNLTSKADFKSYAGIKSTNSDDIIDFLIPKVSELVKQYCRRTFVDHWSTAKVEYSNGGFKDFILQETPLIAVASVEQSLDYGQTWTTLAQYDYWVPNGDVITCTGTGVFPQYLRGYKITYTGGFEDVPGDLEIAVLDIINYYMKNDSAVHTHKNANPNTMQVEYISNTQFPAHIKRVLDNYKADYQ